MRLLTISLLFYIFCFTGGILAKDEPVEENNTYSSPFGVLEFLHWNHPWNEYKYPDQKALQKAVALMKKAGIGWVRMDFLWQDIEPEQGQFQFDKYDYMVDLLVQNNIHVLGILQYSASWASLGGKWNSPPKDNRYFVNYASRVVSRYKDKIKHWEVWNEPDSSTYWKEQDGLKTYCGFLKEVYVVLKKIDPECKVLNGGLANGASSVNRLYDNGAKDYFDILNIHIFDSPLHPDAIKRVVAYPKLARKIMIRNGDVDKKIWVTEIGCPGVKKGRKVKNWWMGDNSDELYQANWVKEIYTELLKDASIEKVFWAFFRDCNKHWDNGVDYFGLIRWDYSLKPAFFAYQECVNNQER